MVVAEHMPHYGYQLKAHAFCRTVTALIPNSLSQPVMSNQVGRVLVTEPGGGRHSQLGKFFGCGKAAAAPQRISGGITDFQQDGQASGAQVSREPPQQGREVGGDPSPLRPVGWAFAAQRAGSGL